MRAVEVHQLHARPESARLCRHRPGRTCPGVARIADADATKYSPLPSRITTGTFARRDNMLGSRRFKHHQSKHPRTCSPPFCHACSNGPRILFHSGDSTRYPSRLNVCPSSELLLRGRLVSRPVCTTTMSGAGAVRMRVLLSRSPCRGTARVPDAVAAVDRIQQHTSRG